MHRLKDRPPKLGEWLLKRFLLADECHEKLGDFEEGYHIKAGEKGKHRALVWYWLQLIMTIPVFVKNLVYWKLIMFKNHLKIAFRNMNKQKVYSLINISGLVIGFTCFILIFLFIQYESSFDRHHEHYDRIYKAIFKIAENYEMGTPLRATSHPPLVPALINRFPEIETATRFSKYIKGFLTIKSDKFFVNKWVWADNRIFNVFTLPFIYGDPETALNKPFSAVIDEETARKYFGKENPVGKTFLFADDVTTEDYIYQITGVLKNIPAQSHFKPHFIGAFETQRSHGLSNSLDNWRGHWFHSYILLKEGCDYHELEKKIQAFFKKNVHARDTYVLQPLTDIHLKSADVLNNLEQVGDIKFVYICIIISLFILFIACINFINLSTARSINRSREVCIRKVVGAHRSQLMKQFLYESILFTFFSLLIASVLAYIFLNKFAQFIERDLTANLLVNGKFILSIIGIGSLVGILSGCYPALLLSGFKPVTILKGAYRHPKQSLSLRNILVVFQFSISTFLIISTLVVSNQLNYIQNRKPGYNREHIVVVDIPFSVRNIFQTRGVLKNELLRNPSVQGITFSLTLPIRMNWGTSANFEGRKENEQFDLYFSTVDYDFLDVFDMELVAGRNFSRKITSDVTGGSTYILNETAVKRLRWENPIGKKFCANSIDMGTVIGVVKDFDSRSLHLKNEPVALKLDLDEVRYISIKINSGNVTETIAAIKNVWNKFSSGYPFDYYFLDEAYDKMYKSEIRLNTVFKYFSLLAIFISCLGLFGLASFIAEKSKKEISIRKTLGASIQDIIMLLSWKFIKWIILANIIGLPLGYYAMYIWLQDFAYRVNMNVGIFILSVSLPLIVAWLTVSFHSIKAATANPVDSLRYE